jgi:hypothetical protein
MRRFWSVGEAAQADYETLREHVLEGTDLVNLAGVRFQRLGLAATDHPASRLRTP